MKTLNGRQYSFKEVTQFSLQKKVLDPPAPNIHLSLTREAVLVPFTERSYFAQRWCSSPMKTLRGRQYSFKQQIQFTILNKMLDPLGSNINDSISQATLHFPFTCMG
jgi:hypothetical protein